MKLTKHFSERESIFSNKAIELKIENIPNTEQRENIFYTANRLEAVRLFLGVALKIDSWFRSYLLNIAVGGVPTSYHAKGLAVDFVPVGMKLEEAFDLIKDSGLSFDQLILYKKKGFIHIGFRKKYSNERNQILYK